MIYRIFFSLGLAILTLGLAGAQEVENVQEDLIIVSDIQIATLKKQIEIANEEAEEAEDVRKNARKQERKAERKLDDLEDLLKDIEDSKEEIAEAKENIRSLEMELAQNTGANTLATKKIIKIKEDILDEKGDILKQQEKLRGLVADLR